MSWIDPKQYNPKDVCSLCLKKFGVKKAVYKTQCNHIFHNNCLENYCKHNSDNIQCPLCREFIDDCNRLRAFRKHLLDPNIFDNKHVKHIYDVGSESSSHSSSSASRTHRTNRRKIKRKGRTARARGRVKSRAVEVNNNSDTQLLESQNVIIEQPMLRDSY